MTTHAEPKVAIKPDIKDTPSKESREALKPDASYPTVKDSFKVKQVPIETFQKEAAVARAEALPEPVLLGIKGEDRKKEKEILVELEAHKDHADRDADVTALKAKPVGNNTRAGDNKIAQVKANPELANKNRTVTVLEDTAKSKEKPVR